MRDGSHWPFALLVAGTALSGISLLAAWPTREDHGLLALFMAGVLAAATLAANGWEFVAAPGAGMLAALPLGTEVLGALALMAAVLICAAAVTRYALRNQDDGWTVMPAALAPRIRP